MFVTAGLVFLLVGVVGVFGGLLAGQFYEEFRKGVGARRSDLTVSVLFAEWWFAVAAPFIGLLAFSAIGGWVGSR